MKKYRFDLWGLAIVVCILLLVMARNPNWYHHAQVDIWVMWERVEYWISHQGSWLGLQGNEILPATLLTALLPVLSIPAGWESYATYLAVILIVNLGVLIGHGLLVRQKKQYWITLLLFGPLLLFRYDAWVTLAVLIALVNFEHKHYGLSGWWLGISVGMKVFPIIFLPYLLMLLIKERKWRKLVEMLFGALLGLGVPVMIYMLMGGSWEQISGSLAFHNQKLISIESIPGNLIIGWSLLMHAEPPAMIPGNGIWAVAGPAQLLNRFWLIPIACYYWLVYKRTVKGEAFSWFVPLLLTVIFLVFAKNLNPQYLWWFVTLMAMTKIDSIVWKWVGLAAITNQLVFPVYYSVLVDNFFGNNTDYWIFYLLTIRNVSIVVVAITLLTIWLKGAEYVDQNK